MKRFRVVTGCAVAVLLGVGLAPASTFASEGVPSGNPAQAWSKAVPFTERVASSPVSGGGYPGSAPAPGGCVRASYDSNFSEASLALRPGSEQLAGGAKAYFDRWSTYKAQHTVSFAFSGKQITTHLVGGFDCVSTGTQTMPPSWTNVTDPNLVWDTHGRLHQLALPFNAWWGSIPGPNGAVHAVFSDDGGRTWLPGNSGKPVEDGPEFSVDSANFLDKPWIAANQNPASPWVDHIYGAWVLFNGDEAQIHTAVTRDHGATWVDHLTVPAPQKLGPKNPWPMIAVGPDGVLYLSYVTYGATSSDGKTVPATIWSTRSTDDGASWTGLSKVADTTVTAGCCVPGTTLHRSIVQYLAVSPDQPGHLYVAWNAVSEGQVDVKLAASSTGGTSWSAPATVNDDSTGSNQFSATVAAGPRGAVAVGFYDMRAACPKSGEAVLPADRGRSNTCIGLTVQAYRDHEGALSAVGSNALVSKQLWDPYQPGQARGGLSQLACESPGATCTNIFIGDYFSMQLSDKNLYVLSSSTAPASLVLADGGGQIHYQQQLLTTVARKHLGL